MSGFVSHIEAADALAEFFQAGAGRAISRREARSCPIKFVRSQTQIAANSEGATGRRMTAIEVFDNYGPDVMREVIEEGSSSLITTAHEPATTLRDRREALGLSQEDVATYLRMDIDAIRKAETPRRQSSIRDLDRIAQALALNEYQLGRPGAEGDITLARAILGLADQLRGMPPNAANTLAITEAAWVVARQLVLVRRIAESSNLEPPPTLSFGLNDGATDMESGFSLAEQLRGWLRERFPLFGQGPITSLQAFIETCLQIPVVSATLDERLACVAVSTGSGAGIVINERGENRHIWTRRVSLAKALGYVLLHAHRPGAGAVFETHDTLESDYAVTGSRGCLARQAGAFALAFLAPPSELRQTVANSSDAAEVTGMVMMVHGITARAAFHHVKALTRRNVPSFPVSDVPWSASMGRDTSSDSPAGAPLARAGHFAWLTAKALKYGLLSHDSALAYLQSGESALRDYLNRAGVVVI